MLKKILLSFLVANFLFFSIFTSTAKAQSWYSQNFFDWYAKVYDDTNPDEIFGERYTAAQVEWVIFGTFSWIINNVGFREINWCLINNLRSGITGGLFAFLQGIPSSCADAVKPLCALATWTPFAGFDTLGICNVFGDTQSPLPYASTIPAQVNPKPPPSNFNMFPAGGISFVSYVKSAGEKLNIIPETKAQGFGAEAAVGVQNIWGFVRDLSYFLLVIAIVVMAFMIMFRVKLSPQTTITLQSAIPRIILTLILVTFSYAISGFLIDLMYVVLGLLAGIFTQSISNDSWRVMFDTFTQGNTAGLFVTYWVLWLIAFIYSVWAFASEVLGAFAAILFILLAVILVIVLLVITIRIWWMLIRNFVEILLLIIFSPLFILGGLVGIGGFGAWLRQMASRLAVYPVVAVLLVFAFFFLATPFASGVGGGAFVGTFPFNPNIEYVISDTTAWQPPLTFGANALDIIFVLVSLVTLTLIPRAADIIRGAISGRPFAMGTAIGEALRPGQTFGLWAGRQGESQTLGRYAAGLDLSDPSRLTAFDRWVLRRGQRMGYARTASQAPQHVERT